MRLTREQYIEHMHTAPIACLDVVFFDPAREHVLLFRRVNEPVKGIFFTPGGCIEKGETFTAAAKRKMHEELGIDVDIARLEGPHVIEEIWPNSAFEGVSYHAVTTYFGYTLHNDELAKLRLDAQHDEYGWFEKDDPTLHQNIKTRISILDKTAI